MDDYSIYKTQTRPKTRCSLNYISSYKILGFSFFLFIYFPVVLLSYSSVFAQNKIDSLNSVLSSLSRRPDSFLNDTTKINMLIMLSRELLVTGNYDKAMEKVNEAITQAKKQMKGNPTTNLTTLKKGLANAYNIKGNINFAHGNYNEALRNHFSALNIRVEFGDKSGISSSYNNIGNIYYHQNNDKEALKNYFHSLKIREEIDDKKGIANSYVTIGNIYYGKAVLLSSDSAFFQSLLYSKALHNYHAALKIQEEIGDKNGIASSLINIGTINNLLKNLTIQEIIF